MKTLKKIILWIYATNADRHVLLIGTPVAYLFLKLLFFSDSFRYNTHFLFHAFVAAIPAVLAGYAWEKFQKKQFNATMNELDVWICGLGGPIAVIILNYL